jgi:hypothetical protein
VEVVSVSVSVMVVVVVVSVLDKACVAVLVTVDDVRDIVARLVTDVVTASAIETFSSPSTV